MADFFGLDPQKVGETIGAIVIALGTGWAARRSGEKQGRKEGSPDTAGVIAASFVERGQMTSLIAAVTALTETGGEIAGHLEQINRRMHDQELLAAAVAKMREERG